MSAPSIHTPSPHSEYKQSRFLSPTTNSIPLVDPVNGKIYSLLHTAAVVALFVAQFPALVAEPYWMMIWDLGPLMLLQCIYYVPSIPATGTWSASISGARLEAEGAGSVKTGKGSGTGSLRRRPYGQGRVSAGRSSWSRGKLRPTILAITLTLLLPPIPLTVSAHVLGAPLYPPELILHTAVLSLHVSCLACLPLFYTHGISGPAWRDVVAAWLPFDEAGVWGGSIGCVVGGWLGAIPIALDWDRDWQAWPITVLVGCYGGWALGKTLLGPVFLKGRRIDMSVDSESELGSEQASDAAAKGGKKIQ